MKIKFYQKGRRCPQRQIQEQQDMTSMFQKTQDFSLGAISFLLILRFSLNTDMKRQSVLVADFQLKDLNV